MITKVCCWLARKVAVSNENQMQVRPSAVIYVSGCDAAYFSNLAGSQRQSSSDLQ